MDIQIRTARPEDADFIALSNIEMALETENKHLDPDIIGPGVLGIFENSSRGFYLIAEVEGKVAGTLLITYEWSDWRNGNMWWFQSVYVKPQFRGTGIFSKLYHHIMEMAKTNNVKEVRLYVETENLHAQKVYEKLGMEKSHYYMYEVVPG